MTVTVPTVTIDTAPQNTLGGLTVAPVSFATGALGANTGVTVDPVAVTTGQPTALGVVTITPFNFLRNIAPPVDLAISLGGRVYPQGRVELTVEVPTPSLKNEAPVIDLTVSIPANIKSWAGTPPPVDLVVEVPTPTVGYTLAPIDVILGTTPEKVAVARTIYTLVLTGAQNGKTDLRLPIDTATLTQRWEQASRTQQAKIQGGVFTPSGPVSETHYHEYTEFGANFVYNISVTLKGLDTYIDDIKARAAGDLVFSKGVVVDGVEYVEPIFRAKYNGLTSTESANSYAGTLSGQQSDTYWFGYTGWFYGFWSTGDPYQFLQNTQGSAGLPEIKIVPLKTPIRRSENGTDITYECEVNNDIRLRDTATIRGESIQARNITIQLGTLAARMTLSGVAV